MLSVSAPKPAELPRTRSLLSLARLKSDKPGQPDKPGKRMNLDINLAVSEAGDSVGPLGATAAHPSSQIYPGLLLGTAAAANSPEFLKRENITHVVTVAGDVRVPDFNSLGIAHLRIPALDNALWSMSAFLRSGSEFISDALEPRYLRLCLGDRSGDSFPQSSSPQSESSDQLPKVLVHCALGLSRSPTLIAAHLITLSRLQPAIFLALTANELPLECAPNEVLDFIHDRREGIRPNGMFVKNLHAWCGKMDVVKESGWEALANGPPKKALPVAVPRKQSTVIVGSVGSVGSTSSGDTIIGSPKKGLKSSLGKLFGSVATKSMTLSSTAPS